MSIVKMFTELPNTGWRSQQSHWVLSVMNALSNGRGGEVKLLIIRVFYIIS